MIRFPFADDIRAVLFDAGNTLLCIDHALLAGSLRAAGHEFDEPAVRLAEMRARPLLDPILARAAKRESREIVETCARLVIGNLGIDPSGAPAAAALAAFHDAWPRMWNRVPPDARDALAALRRRGLRLAVVSNSTGVARALLREAGLLDAFEFVVDSHEVGVEKPDPRIFAHAADRLGVEAASCLHVGDLYSIDVAGARAAGMHAVLLDPVGVWGHVDAVRVSGLAEVAERLGATDVDRQRPVQRGQ